jgi:chlorobactene glucosyltransferase
MATFVAAIAWILVVVILIVRAVRQLEEYDVLAVPEHLAPDALPSLTVVVPARDEAQNIGACLDALLKQEYSSDKLQIILADDGSTDGTAEIARKIAATHPQLRVLDAGPLPRGWDGKPHALAQGTKGAQSEWLCFIDADVVAMPPLLASAVVLAQNKAIDMLSLEPFQVLGSFWERVIIPAGFLLLAFAEDTGKVNDPNDPDATADGQFILIRRAAYESVGGHAAVRAEIIEDTALARVVKHAGYLTHMMGGDDLIRVRMYTNLRDLWEGLSKNSVYVLGSKAATLVGGLAGMILGWAAVALPIAAAVNFAQNTSSALGAWALGLALLGTVALAGVHIGEAVYFRIPLWYGLLFPLGFTMTAGLAVSSVREHMKGVVTWKGRQYSVAGDSDGEVPSAGGSR